MSVIIRLQNLPWSANAMDIRNFFRGLSIPEGGVHIVGGELGDAFIAFSTDEDARQGFMLDGGKIKEVQVKLLLSSRSEMHKVIEAARQSVPLPAVAPPPAPAPAPPPSFLPALAPLSMSSIPGLGNPLEVPQPAVIPPPAPLLSPPIITTPEDNDIRDTDTRRSRDKRRTKSSSRSRSRSRDRNNRKRDRRERSRSRDRSERRRRNERSRSRDRRDRRDRRRDRSRERSPPRRRRESPQREPDPKMQETYSRLQEIGNKRNPNAFQGNGSPIIPQIPVLPGACVVIRNAPTHTSYGDVRRFFPAMIDKHGIKMINDTMGHRTGNIFVRFVDPRSKQMVLSRKHNELKGSLVTVEHLEEAEYDMAVDSFLPFREENAPPLITGPPCSILRLADLPFYIQEHDIIKALNEYSLLSIVLNMNRVSRTKVAYVQFAKVQDAQLALRNKDRLVFGKRPAVVSPLTEQEYEREKALQSGVGSGPSPPPPSPPPAAPAPPRDPRQRRPDPAPLNNFNAPTPASFAPFHPNPTFEPNPPFDSNTPFQHERAWNRAFTPQAPQQPEFRNFQNFQPEPEYIPGPKRPFNQNGVSPVDEPLECVLMKGLPRDATDRTIVEFLRETGAVPARIHLMLDGGGRPSGDCFCEFRSPGDARRAAARHGATLHDLRVSVDLVPRSLVRAALDAPAPPAPAPPPAPLGPPPYRGRGGFMRGRGAPRGGRGRGRGAPPRDDDPALLEFGAPGCVVSMENVPFRATVDDILNFFSEFELSQDDVIRRFNDRGQATGDARVAFPTPFDAQRAVKTHHMEMIYDRRITLTIV